MGGLGWKPEAGDGFNEDENLECGDGVGYIYIAFTS